MGVEGFGIIMIWIPVDSLYILHRPILVPGVTLLSLHTDLPLNLGQCRS